MKKNFKKAGAALALIGVPLAFIGCTPAATETENTPVATGETMETPVVTSETTSEVSAYKNGTYDAVGNYTSPAGAETLGVKVTIENNIVTDATVEPQAENPGSKKFQADFAANYKESVVGKNINDLNVGKIAGSSLTPEGFNDAIAKVKEQAQS